MKYSQSRFVPLLVTILVGLLIGLGTAPSQAAAGKIKLCTSDNFKGSCLTRASYDTNFGNDYVTCTWCLNQTFNDAISSVDNPTAYWWKLYEDKKYGGYELCVRPYGYDKNLGNNTKMEDDISSAKRQGKTRPAGCDKVIG